MEPGRVGVRLRERARSFAACCFLALGLTACDEGTRVVRAHHTDGRVASETTEVRGEGGAWTADGPFRSYHASGAPHEDGHFRDGVRDGRWTKRYPDGTVEEAGSFLFGEREGVWVFRDPDGAPTDRTGLYEAGERIEDYFVEGVYTDWYADDRPRERVSYVDGLRHGPASSWYPNGNKRSEGHYENGRRVGRWSYWREDGSPDPERTGVYRGWQEVVE